MTKKNQPSSPQQRPADSERGGAYAIRPIEIAKFDDYYYMRKLAQLNHNLGFCTTLADYSYAFKDSMHGANKGQSRSSAAKAASSMRLADCSARKLVVAAFSQTPAKHEQTVGMAGLSYSPRDSKGAVMVYLWGVYVEKPHRGRGVAKRLIAAALSQITAELGCAEQDLVLTAMDSPIDSRSSYNKARAQTLSVNLSSATKGENRIDQGLGFNSDPLSVAS